MTVVISDVLIYLHKGIFMDCWKKATFKLCSDGILYKLIDGQIKRSIDLKCVFRKIKVKSVTTGCVDLDNSSSHSIEKSRLPNINLFSSQYKNSFMIHAELTKFMLIEIPLRQKSKKSLTLLFEKMEKFNEWLKAFDKWGSLPKIMVEYVSFGKASNCETANFDENREQEKLQKNMIEIN